MYNIRTDLAIESQEGMRKNQESIPGVRCFEQSLEGDACITTVYIDTENAALFLNRPKGVYVTYENRKLPDMEKEEDIARQIAKIIRRMLKQDLDLSKGMDKSVLIIGLGNKGVTADALGPEVVENLFITRHLIKEYGPFAISTEKVGRISGIAPGVMAQTGMESKEIIKGLVEQIHPDYVITVDALAARNGNRLGKTIQFTDTGITPGSGVGNHRVSINESSIGKKVLSIGVPTVIDAATLVFDTLMESKEAGYRRMDPKLQEMFVTPKDIDESNRCMSKLISQGINIAFLGE